MSELSLLFNEVQADEETVQDGIPSDSNTVKELGMLLSTRLLERRLGYRWECVIAEDDGLWTVGCTATNSFGVGNHMVAFDQLKSKDELMNWLVEYGTAHTSLMDFCEDYRDKYQDELCWQYPISDGKRLGTYLVLVKEGILGLPYDEADKEDYELFTLEDACLFSKSSEMRCAVRPADAGNRGADARWRFDMMIRLYQTVLGLDEQCLTFRDMSYFRSVYGDDFPAELYEMVFCGDVDISTPEDAFRVFNVEHPAGYKGRSMSMSDVLEIVRFPDESKYFFRNFMGFEQIQFDREKAMLPILNHGYEHVLEIRQNVTAYFIGHKGLTSVHCSKFVLHRCRYSQSQLGYQIQYFPWREDKPKTVDFLFRPKVILTSSLAPFPRQMLYEEDHGVEIMRCPAYSEGNLDIVLVWLRQRYFPFEKL